MDAKFGNNLKGGMMMALPVLRDPIFLKKWTAFIKAMGQKYAHDEAEVLIQMAGMDYTGGEMHLPKSKGDIAHWARIGYTKEKLVGARQHVIDAYADAFPDKCLALDVSLPILQDGTVEAVLDYV